MGGAAYLLAHFLRFTIHSQPRYHFFEDTIRPFLDGRNGLVSIGAFLIFFGGLFAILRLWKMGDPLRRGRLTLFPIAASVIPIFL